MNINFASVSYTHLHPQYCAQLCQALAQAFAQKQVETVIGPAMGGILVAYEVARALGVRSIFAEREEGHTTFRRGFAIRPGEKILRCV